MRWKSWLSPSCAPVVAVLFYVLLWWLHPHQFEASDPWNYSLRAFRLWQDFDFGDPHLFNQRLAVSVPVAVSYSLFGVGVLATNLWPLCAAALVIVAVWLATPDHRSGIAAMFLAATSVPLFESSTALYPDVVATAFMAWSSLVLFNRRRWVQTRMHRAVAPFAVALLFTAALAKESAYWVLPLWAMAWVSDARDSRRAFWWRRFHVPALVAALMLAVAYAVFCARVWADPLAHLHSIEALTGRHIWSAGDGSLVNRLTVGPLALLVDHYGVVLVVLAAWGAFSAFRGAGAPSAAVRPWAAYTGWCLFFYWFGSASLRHFEPLPLEGRMTLPLLPGLLVLAAHAACSIAQRTASWGRARVLAPALVVVLAGLPFVRYVESWRGQVDHEAEAMAIVARDLVAHPETTHLLICADERSSRSLAFHFGYRYPPNLRVVPVEALTAEHLASGRKLLFRDRRRSEFLRESYGKKSYDEEIDALGLEELYRSRTVALYASEKEGELDPLVRAAASAQGSSR